jgi:hypothetical protein
MALDGTESLRANDCWVKQPRDKWAMRPTGEVAHQGPLPNARAMSKVGKGWGWFEEEAPLHRPIGYESVRLGQICELDS